MQHKSRRVALELLSFGLAATMTRIEGARAGEFQMNHSLDGHGVDWVPFEMPDGRHIIVTAKIGDMTAEVIVDSGAGKLVLARSFAARLGLRARGAITGVGVTGQASGVIVEGPSVFIGRSILRPREATVYDLDGLSAATGRPIVAVLGRDLFDNFVVTLDFVN